ncbi:MULTISPECIES: PKD domain-containing protein [Chryseobacterium]|uniref:PKD domain-containing protein n=1 Tax=Chryseobacterium TaxID=59732 RepID=UPI00195DC81E|nr:MULTISPECIES: PKD domain-containing protein [Chryseobacterium]MBM7418085.1 hypothetical protein [Chryseobacterium sp. JUb44]MDH6212288.1 hypothetical protein [Chryseobacterium sp. BIGb0186]WSO10901.1 PKD domain-containing protein [Chryseobacterium scophthalmum]
MKKFSLFFLLFCAILVSAQSPLSKFSAAVSGANSVTFTNESTGSPTSFTWEFTGGTPSSSTSPNPGVTYTTAGIYTAKLTVNNASGSSVSTRTIQVSAANVVDLCTGRNDDGTIMAEIGASDSDWKYKDPNGVTGTPVTRHSNSIGWSSASTGGITGITRWITGNNAIIGDHYYESKEFEIPNGVTTAVLNLRSLSFVRNWTYLVKKNSDGSETESLVTTTTWMSDGAKGWLNSRSPELISYPLSPGKYYVKVKVYTNNTGQRQATDVNANVNFGLGFTFSPIAEFSATPTSTNVGSNVQFSNLSQGSPTSVSWNFEDGTNVLTSTQNNPTVAFSTVGNHYAELSANYGSGLLSSLKINNYIQTVQAQTPIVSSTQPSCSVSTGSITVTSPATGVTYSFDNGVSFQASNTLSGLAAGTYVVKVKNQAGSISDAVSVVINPALSVPQDPVLNITQPACGTGTGSITVTSPSTDVQYSFDGGITYQTSNVKAGIAPGTYTIVVKNSSGCTSTATATIAQPDCRDWTKAPNSYIYTGKDANNNEVDGIYIPVKKAYAMWNDQNGLVNDPSALVGAQTAEVYWEDVAGLIRSANYILPIEIPTGGSAQDAKIKVQIDKAKGKGNAVVALKVNNKIIWSWHVWVTDDPTGGVNYGHVNNDGQLASYVENGITKKFTPKWMDRNLGATNKNFIGYDWNKSGGLMYQWGRKDPFPAFENKDGSMYEVSGTAGVKKHLYDYTGDGAVNNIASVQRQYPDINSNIKYAVNNPLNLIFINTVSGDAWFAQNIGVDNATRKKADLWGDNSELAYNTGGAINTYKPKTSYDPCPNNWRVPSYINNAFSLSVQNAFSPWGRNQGNPSGDKATYSNIKPTQQNDALVGIKIYANLGIDFTNTTILGVRNRNMGVYPGNGKYVVGSTGDFYHQDPHEIIVQSATVASISINSNGEEVNNPYSYYFNAYGDAGQFSSQPDTAQYPNMFGKYYAFTYESGALSGAAACRCIEDKYTVNYNFPTEYLTSNSILNFTDGITEPNSYAVTKAATEQEIHIPIAKAFSVYNQYLSDHGMLNFSNLKVNVYWADNKSLISNVKVINIPTNISNIKDGYISVKIAGNQIGNALISLHSDNISNPAYWSWHVWVNNSDINEVVYQTEDVLLPTTSNYVNFTNSGAQPMKSTFMDRNLGATDAFPNVVNPEAVTEAELVMINNSAGMQYQWGRKDPIPSFIKTGLNTAGGLTKTGDYSIWTSSGPDANGNIYASSFTELNGNNYVNNYTKRRGVDYGTVGTSKKEKIQNNLKYSVENPLAFMMPNEKYTNKSSFNAAYGQDWLFSTPNQMMERWGHATVKSPFDPCPGGWRVPDISFTVPDNEPGDINHTNDNKGSSPWYNGFFKPNASVDKFKIHTLGIVQDVGFEIKNPSDIYNGGVSYYLGSIVKNSNLVYGYQFNGSSNSGNTNTQYKIGNYPATGFRGFSNGNALSSSMNLGLSGVWTGALKSANSYGTAYNLAFETINASLSRLIAMNEFYTNHPMNAMNVRCVKEEPRFGQMLGTASNMGRIATNTSEEKDISNNTFNEQKDDIEIYPNPVKNLLYVKSTTPMMYEIYDTGGRMISKGQILNGRIDCSTLIKGLYVLKLNGAKGTITKKIVKE